MDFNNERSPINISDVAEFIQCMTVEISAGIGACHACTTMEFKRSLPTKVSCMNSHKWMSHAGYSMRQP